MLQALQHIYQKSGYNYQKMTSQVHIGTLMSGPGIASVEGTSYEYYMQSVIVNTHAR